MTKLKIILLGLFGLYCSLAMACLDSIPEDLNKRFQDLNHYKESLLNKNLNYEGLEQVRDKISATLAFSEQCIAQEEKKIVDFSNMIQDLNQLKNQQSLQVAENQYDDKLCLHQTRKILCGSLKIIAQETLLQHGQALSLYYKSLKQSDFLQSIERFKKGRINFLHVSSISDYFDLEKFTSVELLKLIKVSLIGFIFGMSLFLIINYYEEKIQNFAINRFFHYLKYFLSCYSPIILPLFLVLNDFDQMAQKPMLAYTLSFLQLVVRLVFIFHFFYAITSVANNQEKFKRFRHQMNLMLFLILIQYFVYDFLRGYFVDQNTINFIAQMGIFIFAPVQLWLAILVIKSWIDFKDENQNMMYKKNHLRLIILALSMIFVFNIYISLKINNELAYHLPSIIIVFGIIIWFLKALFQYLIAMKKELLDPQSLISSQLNNAFGKQANQIILKLYLIIFTIVLILALLIFNKVFSAVGIPQVFIGYLQHSIFKGFYIGQFLIKPFFLIQIIFVVLIINTIGEMVSQWYVSSKDMDVDKKFTIMLLIKGFSWLIALLIVLMMLGVHQEQVSLILGAMSVGISIGSRGLIADFLGGVYLIFLKPVCIGDYIEISEIEGQVKKISLLTTILTTSENTMLHVPNEQFLGMIYFNKSNVKKNIPCMLEFKIQNIHDFDMAKTIILNVVEKKAVSDKKEKLAPYVLFDQDKGGYSLKVIFNIGNIKEKSQISSSVQLEVLQGFREHDIAILEKKI